MHRSREFSADELSQLMAQRPPFSEHPRELRCPACGKTAVRNYRYRYRATPRSRVVRIGYTWCAVCRLVKGTTGPDEGPEFTDPLAALDAEERDRVLRSLPRLLRTLDELWERGELPQRFN